MAGRVLVIGRSGQVARALREAAWPDELAVDARGREMLNLTDTRAVSFAIAEGPWAAVVNAAAYTAVDKAQSEREAAFALNADGLAALALACAQADVPLIQLSTDYVFDGEKTAAYREDDPVNPLGVYGESKEAGERAIRERHAGHVILRTSWVFSATGRNFVNTMLQLAAVQPELCILADQRGRPTAAADIAAAIVAIVIALRKGKRDGYGTFHFACAGTVTWFGFAEAIFRKAGARGFATIPSLKPITIAEYPTAARRPLNSVLNTSRIERIYSIIPRAWEKGLDETLDLLIGKTLEQTS